MEAGTRWFRPNEIYAVLANYARFKVHAQPIDKPISMCSAFAINPWLYCTLHMCLFSLCNLYMTYLNKRKQNRSLCVEVPSIKRLCSLSFWVWTIWFVCRMNSSNYPSVQGQLLYCLECYDWSSAGIHKRRDEWMNECTLSFWVRGRPTWLTLIILSPEMFARRSSVVKTNHFILFCLIIFSLHNTMCRVVTYMHNIYAHSTS